jgi:hypothetical protein
MRATTEPESLETTTPPERTEERASEKGGGLHRGRSSLKVTHEIEMRIPNAMICLIDYSAFLLLRLFANFPGLQKLACLCTSI